MVELQVHLAERLLHVQDVLSCHLQQAGTVPPQGANGAVSHRVGGRKLADDALPQLASRRSPTLSLSDLALLVLLGRVPRNGFRRNAGN
jgi:hypothetical protein